MRRFEVCHRTWIGNFGSVYFHTLDESVRYYFDSIIKAEVKQALILDNKKDITLLKYTEGKYEAIRRN